MFNGFVLGLPLVLLMLEHLLLRGRGRGGGPESGLAGPAFVMTRWGLRIVAPYATI